MDSAPAANRSPGAPRRLWIARVMAVLFTLLLTYVLVAPAPLALFGALGAVAQHTIDRSLTDSVQHAVAYAIFTGLWILATRRRTSRLAVIALALLHGAATELLQGLFPPRQSDWFDMLANTCGIASGAAVAWVAIRASHRPRAASETDRAGKGSLLRGFERLLLYSVALILGATLLVGGRDGEPASRDGHENRPADNRPKHAAEPRAGEQEPNPQPAVQPAVTQAGAALERPPEALRDSLVLVDTQGRARIELGVGVDGEPWLALRDQWGRPTVQIRAGSDESGSNGQIVLATSRGTARLIADSERFALEFEAGTGARTRIALDPDGQAEVSVRSDSTGPRAMLRTNANGSAQVSVGGPGTAPSATLLALAGGQLELRMAGANGAAGPRLQLFEDATAQLTLDGPGSQSGPSLIRFADGTSVVAVRRSDGNPAGSMVAAPDGTAVIAAAAPRNGQQAELRVSADGKATIAVVDPQPEHEQPQAPAVPKQNPGAPPRRNANPPAVLSAP